jgi:hypothetical protein
MFGSTASRKLWRVGWEKGWRRKIRRHEERRRLFGAWMKMPNQKWRAAVGRSWREDWVACRWEGVEEDVGSWSKQVGKKS